MKIRNDHPHDMPVPIYDAIVHSMGQYDKGGADYSVTELIDPPQIAHLKREHDGGGADAVQMLDAWIGMAVHGAIEEGAGLYDGSLHEHEMHIEVLGKDIKGALDYWAPSHPGYTGSVLFDWKTVKMWELINGPKPEKIAQINVYAYMAEQTLGLKCDNLAITMIGMDWLRNRAKYEAAYPDIKIRTFAVDKWLPSTTRAYLEDRVRDHEHSRPCTDEERWTRGGYAAVKPGGKRAIKLFPLTEHGNMQEARRAGLEWIAAQQDKASMMLEERPTEYVRCESFCPVADYCEQFNQLK